MVLFIEAWPATLPAHKTCNVAGMDIIIHAHTTNRLTSWWIIGGSSPGAKACARPCDRPGARRISGGDPQQLKRRPGVSGDAGPTGAATAVPRISARVSLASLYWFNVVEFEFAIVDQVRHRCIIRLSFGIEFVFSKVLLFQQRVFFLKSNPETDPSAVEVCAQV